VLLEEFGDPVADRGGRREERDPRQQMRLLRRRRRPPDGGGRSLVGFLLVWMDRDVGDGAPVLRFPGDTPGEDLFAHDDDLPLHVLEQDYIQALFLQELYRASEALVFKGGTFLKHAHGLDRFSEDLDFTRDGDTVIMDDLDAAARALERYGVPAELDRVDQKANTIVGRLRYEGPLFDGSERSRGNIELDVSTRGDVFLETEWQRLFFPYPETRAVTARCLALKEAFAEKLRALSTRTRGRDLYDCWFLLHQNVTIDPALFERKMAVLGRSPRVTITVSEREWDRDLSVLLDRPPAYETVLEDVLAALDDAGLKVGTDLKDR